MPHLPTLVQELYLYGVIGRLQPVGCGAVRDRDLVERQVLIRLTDILAK